MKQQNLDLIKVLIVDDHQLFLDGLMAILRHVPTVRVVGQALSGEDALSFLESNPVDVIITDISMPNMSGEELTNKIVEKYSSVRILALSMHDDFATIERMIQAGVHGYILKNTGRKELIEAINTICSGQNFFSNDIKSVLVKQMVGSAKSSLAPNSDDPNPEIFLSKREKTIVRLIVEGFTLSEIIERVGLNETSVLYHRRNIFSKLHVDSHLQLIDFVKVNNVNLD